MKTKILSSLFVLFTLISVAFLYGSSFEANAEIPIDSRIDVPAKFQTAIVNKDIVRFRECFSIAKLPYAFDANVKNNVYELLFYSNGFMKQFMVDLKNYKIVKTSYAFEGKAINLGLLRLGFTLEKDDIQKTVFVYLNAIQIDGSWYIHVEIDDPVKSITGTLKNLHNAFKSAFDKKINVSNEMMEFMLMLDGTKESAAKAIEKYRDNAKIELDGLNKLPLAEAKVIESKDGVYVVDFTIAFDTLVRYKIFWENGKITSAKKIER